MNTTALIDKYYLIEAKIAYYMGKPFLTDEQYDALETHWKQENPNDTLPVDMGTYFQDASTPYLSSRKVSKENLAVWLGKRGGWEQGTFTPKVDGVSVELHFEQDLDHGGSALTKVYTRGGVDRTINFIRAIGYHPYIMPWCGTNLPGKVIVRAEAYFPQEMFDELQTLGFKTLRNAAAGLVNNDKEDAKLANRMRFVIWDWINSPFRSYNQGLAQLESCGFPVVPRYAITYDHLTGYEKDDSIRNSFEYELDGFVVWHDDRTQWSSDQGKTEYQNCVAWKFSNQRAMSVIRNILWSGGVSGQVTPVAIIDPVLIGGATITNINLHNPKNMENLNVKIGSQCVVERAGDVIPYIGEPCIDTENSIPFTLPDRCNICGEGLSFDGPRLFCLNTSCSLKFEGVLRKWAEIHEWKFFSDEAIGNLEPYFASGSNHPILLIYRIDRTTLDQYMTPGLANRLWLHLEEAKKKTTICSLIASLNIPSIGLKTAYKIVEGCDDIVKLLDILDERVNNKATPGYTWDIKFRSWLIENPSAWNDVLYLINELKLTLSKTQPLEDKPKVVVTGSIEGLKRTELEMVVSEMGYTMADYVTKDIKFLICDKPSNSSKFKKAAELDIPVVTWAGFQAAIQEK